MSPPRITPYDIKCAHCGTTIPTLAGLWKASKRGYGFCGRRCETDRKIKAAWDSVGKRLWSKVDMSGGQDACWPYLGSKMHYGHGAFTCRMPGSKRSMTHAASRIAYIVTHGLIARDVHVCHSCDNPPCCNPKHLWAGSHADNMRDMKNKGRAARGDKSSSAIRAAKRRKELAA